MDLKKVILFFLAVFIIIGNTSCRYHNRTEAVNETVGEDCPLCYYGSDSYFNKFYIENNKVYFECVYSLENLTSEPVSCSLTACFRDDVGRLVKEKEVTGYVLSIDYPTRYSIDRYATEELKTKEITIPPGRHLIQIVFVGTALGENRKKLNRLLPPYVWCNLSTPDGEKKLLIDRK